MGLSAAAGAARIGNYILSVLASLLIILLFAYGGYSLWDSYVTFRGAFLSGDILKYKPDVSSGDNALSFEELRRINPDVVGWISVNGTHIDYPMVQGENDLEYVNRDVEGNFSLTGSIFLSTQNSADFSDPYNLTYGHHMDNGGMYSDVTAMLDPAFFQKHTVGTLILPDKRYSIELYAAIECDAYEQMIYHTDGIKSNMREFQSFVKGRAANYRELQLGDEDKIISLSTCSDVGTSGRVVLLGRMTQVKEEVTG